MWAKMNWYYGQLNYTQKDKKLIYHYSYSCWHTFNSNCPGFPPERFLPPAQHDGSECDFVCGAWFCDVSIWRTKFKCHLSFQKNLPQDNPLNVLFFLIGSNIYIFLNWKPRRKHHKPIPLTLMLFSMASRNTRDPLKHLLGQHTFRDREKMFPWLMCANPLITTLYKRTILLISWEVMSNCGHISWGGETNFTMCSSDL